MGKRDGKLNYATIQRAWCVLTASLSQRLRSADLRRRWDGVAAIYARPDAPVRVALEMRLTGGSDVLLAPQRGNEATVAIEVLTTLITPAEDWQSFMQDVADRWTRYDERDAYGQRMRPRPHWAKQWAGLEVDGKPIERYMKEDAYREAFAWKQCVER